MGGGLGARAAARTPPCVTSNLSALLTRHGLPCTTIDPRHPKLSTQQLRQIGFRKEWRAMLEAAPTRSPLCRQLLRQWLQTPPKYVTALLRGYDDKGAYPPFFLYFFSLLGLGLIFTGCSRIPPL